MPLLWGIEELFNTFLGGDIALYIFMLLTANMVAEAYRSGVMKNIVGRGDWEETLLSLHRSYDICRICIGHADGRHRCRRSCRQQIWHGDHFLSWLLCSFRCCAHSFCDGAHQLCAYRNDLHQKCNYRRLLSALRFPISRKFWRWFWDFWEFKLTSILSKSLRICRLSMRHRMTCRPSCRASLCWSVISFCPSLLVSGFWSIRISSDTTESSQMIRKNREDRFWKEWPPKWSKIKHFCTQVWK